MQAIAGREPTRSQLLAMAHVDGELAEATLRAFELRLGRESALMREVVELRALELLLHQLGGTNLVGTEWGGADQRARRRR